MEQEMHNARLGWMQATYNIVLRRGFRLRWDPKSLGVLISTNEGLEIVRLGFPLSGRETALTRIDGLRVQVDGKESHILNRVGGPYSVDFTRTLSVFYDGGLAAEVSIKTGLLARLKQAFFLWRIKRLEEAEWPKGRAKGRKRSKELSKLSPSFTIAIAIVAFVVLTLLVVWLGNLVGPVIDSLLHNIAPSFNLLP